MKPAERWVVLALFVWGGGLCLHYGRVGLMPLDQSIVWDGGWRILNGQLPFRDFTTPAGLTPIALQALFFRLFGVTWFVYCLHAAVFNGLYCVLAWRLLRLLGLGPVPALGYAALSGVVFYPPFGVPYMDQHAFFFSLATVWALAEGVGAAGRRRAFWLAAVPWLLTLAYLSKQIPSVLVIPIVGVALLAFPPGERRRALGTLLLSSLTVAAALGLALTQVSLDLVAEFLFSIPAAEGRRRLSGLVEPTAFLGQLAELTRALPAASTVAIVAGGAALLRRPERLRPALALCLLGVCAAFVMATGNQGENGIPLLFVAAGLVHAEAASRSRGARGILPVLPWALLALCLVDGARFHLRVNATRMVHELDGVPEASAGQTLVLPRALSFLEWRLHPFYRFTPEDLAGAVAYLRSEPGGIYVFGDLTLMYALTGRASAGTVLWLHPGLTLPEPGTPAFPEWEKRLVQDLEARQVRFIVRESRQTYAELRLSQLPALASYVERHQGKRRPFGPIDVIELQAVPGPKDAPR